MLFADYSLSGACFSIHLHKLNKVMRGISVGIGIKPFFTFTKIHNIVLVVMAAAIMLVVSCTKKSEFDIGKEFIETNTRLQMIDTFSVDLSTVIQDSLRTSASKVALAGNFSDGIFGTIKCETYFDLGFSPFEALQEKASFDSAAIILPFNGYSFGDTLSPMTLYLHRLEEKIKSGDDGFLYNVSSFAFEPQPLSSKTFFPRPSGYIDTALSFRIDVLGEDIFNKVLTNDENVSSAEWFKDYIKGFVVTPGNEDNKAILGFDANDKKIVLKIYYHLRLEEPDKKEISIPMGEISHQFNHVDQDLSATYLNDIRSMGGKKMASETGNKSYMQGVTGLITKVQFPSLENIFLEVNWKILKAELVIEPAGGSFDKLPLPKRLNIYQTDRINRVSSVLRDERGNSISPLVDDSNNPIIATFKYDKIFWENTSYTFDITSYLNSELAGKYFEYRRGLHIGLSQDDYRMSLDRILFEGKKPGVKLKLYYLSY